MNRQSDSAVLPIGWKGFLAVSGIVCGPAIVGMMLTIPLPILPEIAKHVSAGRSTLIAMPMIGIVTGGITAGYFLSRVPARILMLWAIVAYGLIGLSGMVLQDWPLLISRFLIGGVSTYVSAASTTLIGEYIPLGKRPRILGFQMGGASIVGIAAMNLSGFLVDTFDWRASFTLFPLIAAIIFAIAYFLVPTGRAPVATSAPGAAGRAMRAEGWRLLIGMWPLYLFLLAMNAFSFTTNAQAAFILDDNGISKGAIRAHILSIHQGFMVVGAFCYPLTRRFLGSRWIPAFFLTLMAIGLISLGLAREMLPLSIALVFLGFGAGTLFPHQSSLILARATPEIRGRAVGLMISNQFLADAINPFVFAPIIAAIGLHDAIAGAGLVAAASALIAVAYGMRAADIPVAAGPKAFGH